MEQIWDKLSPLEPSALFLIGSRSDDYFVSSSDDDYLAIVSGCGARGTLLHVEDKTLECVLLGYSLIDNFINEPRTDFIDSAWLTPLCLLTKGKLLCDPKGIGKDITMRVQRYLDSPMFLTYLQALLYRAQMYLNKTERIEANGDMFGGQVARCYATWELVRVILAKKRIFYRGPFHFVNKIAKEMPEFYDIVCKSLGINASINCAQISANNLLKIAQNEVSGLNGLT